MRYEKLLDEAGYPRGADGTRCSTIYQHYEFFDLGYYQIAMEMHLAGGREYSDGRSERGPGDRQPGAAKLPVLPARLWRVTMR